MMKAKDLKEGDLVDLESCPYVTKEKHPIIEFELATVVHVERESFECVAIGYEGIDVIGYSPDQLLKVKRREYNDAFTAEAQLAEA